MTIKFSAVSVSLFVFSVAAKEIDVLSKLVACPFANTGGIQDFLDQLPSQNLAVELQANHVADPEVAFQAVFGDPYSDTFWGRWVDIQGGTPFQYMNSVQGFQFDIACDRDGVVKPVSVSKYKYDEVDNCAMFDYTMKKNGLTHGADMGAVLEGNTIMAGNFQCSWSEIDLLQLFSPLELSDKSEQSRSGLQCLLDYYDASPSDITTLCQF